MTDNKDDIVIVAIDNNQRGKTSEGKGDGCRDNEPVKCIPGNT